MGGAAVQVGVVHLGVRFVDPDGHPGLGRGVPGGVDGHVGEGVLSRLVFIGGVDKPGGAVLGELHAAPGGGVGELEGEGVPLPVHRVKVTGDGNVPVGGQVHVPGDGGLIGGGEQVEGDGGVLRLGGGGREGGGEGEAGGGDGGGGAGLEGQPGQGGGVDHRAHGQRLPAHGEGARPGVGEGDQGDVGQHGVCAGLHRKVLGGEGDGVPHQAVFGEVGHGGDLLLLVPEEGGGGQGQGADQQEGQHGGQSAPEKRKLFQGDDLLIEWMCP